MAHCPTEHAQLPVNTIIRRAARISDEREYAEEDSQSEPQTQLGQLCQLSVCGRT